MDTKNKRNTRSKILFAALELFADNGYNGTSIANICKKANLTKGAIYWHFKDKEDLYESLRKEVFDFAFTRSNSLHVSPAEFEGIYLIRDQIRFVLEVIENNKPAQSCCKILMRELNKKVLVDDICDSVLKTYTIKLKYAFRKALRLKQIEPGLSLLEFTNLFYTLIGDIIFKWLLYKKDYSLVEAALKSFDYVFIREKCIDNK